MKRSPLGRTAIGASHEIYPSAEAACRSAVARCVADRIAQEVEGRRRPARRRRLVVTTPLLRSFDGDLDDIKFLYPVLDNLPLIVFPILSHVLTGARTSVYGPGAVGAVVDVMRGRLLRDGLIADADRLIFVAEDRGSIALAQTFRRSVAPLAAAPGEAVLWSSGDIVLAYNTYAKLMDRHAATHDIVLDLNARQIVFREGEPELFPRNYFDSLRLDDGRVVDVKEPNVLSFTAAGVEGLSRLDALRNPPKGRTYVGVLLHAALKASASLGPAALLAILRYGIRRARPPLSAADALAERHLVALANAVFDVPTMVKAENRDPFLVKDCDSFEDLFGYYRALLQSIVNSAPTREEGYLKLASYYPYANVLYRISHDLLALKADIPLWKRWPEVICDKICTHNRLLRAELAGVGLAASASLIPEYFDASGNYAPRTTAGCDFGPVKAFLRDRYRAAFAADRTAYLRLSTASGSR